MPKWIECAGYEDATKEGAKENSGDTRKHQDIFGRPTSLTLDYIAIDARSALWVTHSH